VPIEKPDDEVLEDQNLDFDATLDFDEPLQEQPKNTAPPAPEPEQEEEVIPFAVIEEKPEYIGEGPQARAEYPDFARRAGIEGVVYLQFIVDKQGNVKNIEVLRSPNETLEEEAIRALKATTFTPGKQRKQPVEVRMSLPVRFKLR
jgi:protein TonB